MAAGGKGQLQLTGRQGEVMQESAKAAISPSLASDSERPGSVVKFEKRVWPPVPSTETEKPMVPVRDLFVFIQFIFIVSNFMVMTVLSTIR